MVQIQLNLPGELNRLLEIEKAKQGSKDKRDIIVELLFKILKKRG